MYIIYHTEYFRPSLQFIADTDPRFLSDVTM